MDCWNAVFSLPEDRQLIRNLESCLHEVVLKKSLTLTILKTCTNNIGFKVRFDVPCSKAKSFNRFYFFVLRVGLPQSIVFISKSNISFLFFSFHLSTPFFLRVWLFSRIIVSFLFIGFFFDLGRSSGPCHDVRYANQGFRFFEGMNFEGRNDELCFFWVCSGEVVYDDIRV